ncbi:unnamed protein product [Protopolystoma xenopodis]|uniref:Uncharacterized protein n=1 Tax=Protopolystoma xenopodis TaxID=117903 RepID=A0A3S5FH36_9PLAT|nr:unnamed protein product [Protopolystoma xenopodis]
MLPPGRKVSAVIPDRVEFLSPVRDTNGYWQSPVGSHDAVEAELTNIRLSRQPDKNASSSPCHPIPQQQQQHQQYSTSRPSPVGQADLDSARLCSENQGPKLKSRKMKQRMLDVAARQAHPPSSRLVTMPSDAPVKERPERRRSVPKVGNAERTGGLPATRLKQLVTAHFDAEIAAEARRICRQFRMVDWLPLGQGWFPFGPSALSSDRRG